MVTALSNDVVCRAIFGGKFTRQEFIRVLHEAMELVASFCLVDLFPSSRLARWLSSGERRLIRSHSCIQCIIADVVDKCKAAQPARGGNFWIRYSSPSPLSIPSRLHVSLADWPLRVRNAKILAILIRISVFVHAFFPSL
jgi:hypothetical protein